MSWTQQQPKFEHRADKGWVYENTTIQIPGARPVSLRQRVVPRELRRSAQQPEAAIFSLSEIIAEPQLNWVLQAGTRLRGGEEDLFSVQWEMWLERADGLVGVWAPERDARGIFRRLAIDEREVRFARDKLERVLATRSMRVAVASALGMSRRQVGDLLSVSPARVQQLLEEAPPTTKAAAQQFVGDAYSVLDNFPSGAVERDEVPLPEGWDRSQLERVLDDLIDYGLLEQDDSGTSLSTDTWSELRSKRLRTISERAMKARSG